MICIILASGQGTRLRPLTADRPKPMVEVGDTHLLSFQFDALRRQGVGKCIVTTGPFADQIRSFARTYDDIDVRFVHNERYAETNYIYSLWLASEELRAWSADEDVILLHGDLAFDNAVLDRLLSADPSDGVVVDPVTDPAPKDFCARVTGTEDGRGNEGRNPSGDGNRSENSHGDEQENGDGPRIVEIDTHLDGEGLHQLYPMYRLSRSTFDSWMAAVERTLDRGGTGEYAEAALNDLLPGIGLRPVWTDGFCAEVDTPSDLAAVEEWWNEG